MKTITELRKHIKENGIAFNHPSLGRVDYHSESGLNDRVIVEVLDGRYLSSVSISELIPLPNLYAF